jgi:hypothetical protein
MPATTFYFHDIPQSVVPSKKKTNKEDEHLLWFCSNEPGEGLCSWEINLHRSCSQYSTHLAFVHCHCKYLLFLLIFKLSFGCYRQNRLPYSPFTFPVILRNQNCQHPVDFKFSRSVASWSASWLLRAFEAPWPQVSSLATFSMSRPRLQDCSVFQVSFIFCFDLVFILNNDVLVV